MTMVKSGTGQARSRSSGSTRNVSSVNKVPSTSSSSSKSGTSLIILPGGGQKTSGYEETSYTIDGVTTTQRSGSSGTSTRVDPLEMKTETVFVPQKVSVQVEEPPQEVKKDVSTPSADQRGIASTMGEVSGSQMPIIREQHLQATMGELETERDTQQKIAESEQAALHAKSFQRAARERASLEGKPTPQLAQMTLKGKTGDYVVYDKGGASAGDRYLTQDEIVKDVISAEYQPEDVIETTYSPDGEIISQERKFIGGLYVDGKDYYGEAAGVKAIQLIKEGKANWSDYGGGTLILKESFPKGNGEVFETKDNINQSPALMKMGFSPSAGVSIIGFGIYDSKSKQGDITTYYTTPKNIEKSSVTSTGVYVPSIKEYTYTYTKEPLFGKGFGESVMTGTILGAGYGVIGGPGGVGLGALIGGASFGAGYVAQKATSETVTRELLRRPSYKKYVESPTTQDFSYQAIRAYSALTGRGIEESTGDIIGAGVGIAATYATGYGLTKAASNILAKPKTSLKGKFTTTQSETGESISQFVGKSKSKTDIPGLKKMDIAAFRETAPQGGKTPLVYSKTSVSPKGQFSQYLVSGDKSSSILGSYREVYNIKQPTYIPSGGKGITIGKSISAGSGVNLNVPLKTGYRQSGSIIRGQVIEFSKPGAGYKVVSKSPIQVSSMSEYKKLDLLKDMSYVKGNEYSRTLVSGKQPISSSSFFEGIIKQGATASSKSGGLSSGSYSPSGGLLLKQGPKFSVGSIQSTSTAAMSSQLATMAKTSATSGLATQFGVMSAAGFGTSSKSSTKQIMEATSVSQKQASNRVSQMIDLPSSKTKKTTTSSVFSAPSQKQSVFTLTRPSLMQTSSSMSKSFQSSLKSPIETTFDNQKQEQVINTMFSTSQQKLEEVSILKSDQIQIPRITQTTSNNQKQYQTINTMFSTSQQKLEEVSILKSDHQGMPLLFGGGGGRRSRASSSKAWGIRNPWRSIDAIVGGKKTRGKKKKRNIWEGLI